MVVLLLIWTRYLQPIFQPIIDAWVTPKAVNDPKKDDEKSEASTSDKNEKPIKAD
uniref:Uncharacterized protein n=1 Tax=Tetranychus urticae TaxID=32264 RepID=T1KQ74_TETUR